MRFTKDDAHKELVSQIPSKGQTLNLSERSISEQLDTLMPILANDDTELSAFVASVLPIFRTADANIRNDVSVGIKLYKESNPVKEETKTVANAATVVSNAETKTDDPNALLLKRIEELERRNADNERKSTLAQRRSDIVSKMTEKGCKDKEWIASLLDEVSLDGDDFDADARAAKYIKMYNKSEAKSPAGVTPAQPKGTANDSYLNEILKSAAEKNKVAQL